MFLFALLQTFIRSLLDLIWFGKKSSSILPLTDGRGEVDGRVGETTPLLAGNSSQPGIGGGAQNIVRAKTPTPVQFNDLPVEVLPLVMFFQVFSTRKPQEDVSMQCDQKALTVVCSVSQTWRAAALSAHNLWSVLPKMSLQEISRDKHESWLEGLQRRILQSGSSPLTFSVDVTKQAYDDRSGFAPRVLSVLIEQCHRWGEAAMLQMPPAAFREFHTSTEGKLALLSRFELTIDNDQYLWDRPSRDPETVTLDLSYPPQLRSIRIHAGKDMVYPVVSKLALGQLEHFGADIYKPSVYQELIDAKPNLKSLRCYFKTPKPVLPIITPTLPELQLLHLTHVGGGDGDSLYLEDLLKSLTTPALAEIVVVNYGPEGEANPDASVYVRLGAQVLALMRRSGCSVQRLDLATMRIPTSDQLYRDIVSACPQLTHLMLYSNSLEELRRLIVQPASTATSHIFLPSLKFLSVAKVADSGEVEADAAMAILDIIWSRSLYQIKARSLVGTVQPLEEVLFEPLNGSKLQPLLGQWEHDNLSPLFTDSPRRLPTIENAQTLDAIASKAISGFFACVILDPSAKRCEEMGRVIDDLMYLPMGTFSTLPLTRRHFPWLMKQWHDRLVHERFQISLWNLVKNVKARSQTLIEKWKPYFIEDIRTTPYRWELGYAPSAMDSGRLRCICNTPATEDDDAVWGYLTAFPPDDTFSLLYQS